MRHALGFVLGVLVGQWLAFGGSSSPAQLHSLAAQAYERRDYGDALRLWTRAVSLQPGDPFLHYLRGTALARLGQVQSATDAYQLALFLDPTPDVARLARDGLSRLTSTTTVAGAQETTVALEDFRGVWIVQAVVAGRPARFLVDTGASVTVVAPALADAVGLRPTASDAMELQTLAGRTMGPVATLATLSVGGTEVRELRVVIHDPGPGVEGILGNTFLGRYQVTLDADRRLLHLRPAGG